MHQYSKPVLVFHAHSQACPWQVKATAASISMSVQDEEHKAQAKVFALGAKDQTLRKQAVQCTEGASKRQELEVSIPSLATLCSVS